MKTGLQVVGILILLPLILVGAVLGLVVQSIGAGFSLVEELLDE